MKPEGIHPTHDDLFAYRDGELPAERRTLIEAHVLGCQACRSFIDEVSGLEAALSRRPDDAGAAYFEHLPDQVLGRIRHGESVATDPLREVARPERRRAPAAGGEDRAPRRPRLSWAAVVSAASAAAAVLVVVVLLVKRGPLGPEVALRSEEPRAPAGESAAIAPPPSGGAQIPKAHAPGVTSTGRPETGATDALRPAAKRERAAEVMGDLKSNAAPPAAYEGEQKMAPRRKDAALDASSAEPQAQRAAPPAQAGLGGSPPGGAEYADLTRRHRLPPLWRPGVAPPALLSAENELRYLYQTGRAGSDSARIRLYLAEAARIRYAEAPDSALHEAIVHHYLRAIRLARSDSGAAQVARERLDSFTR